MDLAKEAGLKEAIEKYFNGKKIDKDKIKERLKAAAEKRKKHFESKKRKHHWKDKKIDNEVLNELREKMKELHKEMHELRKKHREEMKKRMEEIKKNSQISGIKLLTTINRESKVAPSAFQASYI